MLKEKEIIKLRSIGVYLSNENLTCYEQSDKKELLFTIPLSTLMSIEILKSDEREFSVKQLFKWLIGSSKNEPSHKAVIYALILTLKDRRKNYSYLTNFNVIGIQEFLNKLRGIVHYGI